MRDLVPGTAEARRIENHLRSLVGLADAAHLSGDNRGAASPRGAISSKHWRDGDLSFWSSRTSTGQTTGSSTSSTISSDGPVTYRSFSSPPHDRSSCANGPVGGNAELATTIALSPLSEDETRDLVATLARDAAIPAQMTEAIVVNAAGNALYAVEFVRMLADRGLLGHAQARPGSPWLDALALPESLRGIIAARLDSLTAEDKGLLHAGSVIGRVVWPGALSAITGRSRRWITGRLRSLEEREFLQRTRNSSVGREPEYRFRHVLIRDVAYSEIPRARRGEMHRRTAEWLETLSPDRAVDRAEMLAHHYLCAHELARAAGRETSVLADRARRALSDAGDRALTLHAFPAAARFFRAASSWPTVDPERPWLLFRLGKSIYYAETAGADVLIEARDALLAVGDSGTAAEAEAFLAYLAHHQGRHDEFSEHSTAPRTRRRPRAQPLQGRGARRRRHHQSMAGQHDKTIAAAAEALDIARALELPEHEARALSIMGISRGLSGNPAGRDDLERSIAISERVGSHLSADCCGKLADLEGQLGNLEACFALQARARDHAERFGHAPFVRWLAAERVGEGYWTGDWDEALDAAGLPSTSRRRRAELHGGLLPRDAGAHPTGPRRSHGRAGRRCPRSGLRAVRRGSSDALSGPRLRCPCGDPRSGRWTRGQLWPTSCLRGGGRASTRIPCRRGPSIWHWRSTRSIRACELVRPRARSR